MRNAPSGFPVSSSSASVRFRSPTNQLFSSQWGRFSSSSLTNCMRSGFRLFIFLSVSRLSMACVFRSCSSRTLLSWISPSRDLSFS
ncbi:hypothetical protein EYF80_015031 [Liparis tanakae]|uniref:Uncharacterized protein n=1 Tax=Liparis tanakae TaxID=230148 RepID=A0A4Z2ICC1_9TELE|nr:hypothetical protein EYF80_015031 [Liparis tanakae]